MVCKLVNAKAGEWEQCLGDALWAHRVSHSVVTGYTPNFLTYGRHPITPKLQLLSRMLGSGPMLLAERLDTLSLAFQEQCAIQKIIVVTWCACDTKLMPVSCHLGTMPVYLHRAGQAWTQWTYPPPPFPGSVIPLLAPPFHFPLDIEGMDNQVHQWLPVVTHPCPYFNGLNAVEGQRHLPKPWNQGINAQGVEHFHCMANMLTIKACHYYSNILLKVRLNFMIFYNMSIGNSISIIFKGNQALNIPS